MRKDQSLNYKELEWNEAPLYAPDTLEGGLSPSSNTVGSTDTATTTATNTQTHNPANNSKSKSIPHLPLKAESTALLIVDVQPEYWTHCPSVKEDFPHFEENLKRTIQICRSQQAKIIWVRADYRYYHSPWLIQFERLNGGSRPDTKSEIPCDPTNENFAWEEFATPIGNEVVIAKRSWNSATNTALMDYLKVNSIENVLVCGLITSVCVQHSAFSVFEAGYRTLLVEDSCGDRGVARHKAAIALYGNYMYEITTSKQLEDKEFGLLPAKPKWMTFLSNGGRSLQNDMDDNNIKQNGLIRNHLDDDGVFGDVDVVTIESDKQPSPKKQKLDHRLSFDSSPDLITTNDSVHRVEVPSEFENE